MTAPTPFTPSVAVRRADNPGPMTLDGTRSYVLRAPGSPSCVVVDPGPDDEGHLAALAAAGPVELVLITHRHADHTAGSARLHAMTGAPVRAVDPAHCHGDAAGAAPLRGGEVIETAGLRVEVLATPGHTADSACFVVAAPGEAPVVLTGDTVLGSGTTVLAEPDGSLRDYLTSLDRIEAVAAAGTAPVVGLPGHGAGIDDLAAAVRAYRAHRLERLDQVRAALRDLGADMGADVGADTGADDPRGPLADRVVAHVYGDVDPSVQHAARQSVVAQLAFLRGHPDRGHPAEGRG